MKQINITDELSSLLYEIPLFNELSQDIKHQLLTILDYSIYSYNTGETVIRQGELCTSLYILLKGKFKVDIIDGNGSEILVEHLEGPRTFATPHLFKKDTRMPATFVTMEPTTLFVATKESAFKLISLHPEVLKSFLCVAGNCNACTTTRLDILSQKTIRDRLITYFGKHNKKREKIFTFPHTITQLADYLNVSRPALSSEFSKMEKEGMIKRLERNTLELSKDVLQLISSTT